MTKEWVDVVTVTLRSDAAMNLSALQRIRNGIPSLESASVELNSTPPGTRITIIGDEGTVSRKVLPFLCDESSKWWDSSLTAGKSGRVLKNGGNEGVCSHLAPGVDAVIGRCGWRAGSRGGSRRGARPTGCR